MKKTRFMGKAKWVLPAAVVLALGIFTGCGEQQDVGKDAALDAALAHAGINESDAARVKISEELENGKKIYEVSFDAAEKEYDYEIQASDGTILHSDVELRQDEESSFVDQGQGDVQEPDQNGAQTENNGQASGGAAAGGSGSGQQTSAAVSREQAISIALERVPGATQKDIRIELDYDDGQYRYEGEIIYQRKEYEFEIDANTGKVLEWSEEGI